MVLLKVDGKHSGRSKGMTYQLASEHRIIKGYFARKIPCTTVRKNIPHTTVREVIPHTLVPGAIKNTR